MITCVGDLVEDVLVLANGHVRPGSDVFTTIERHRGGSAANVAVAICHDNGSARFVGNLGRDNLGTVLLAELAAEGVELDVSRRGRTGSIVVLVDEGGERSFFTDRGSSSDVRSFSPMVFSQSSAIHVPLYSLIEDPLCQTVLDMAALAARRGVPMTVDASSTAVISDLGVARVRSLLAKMDPSTLFANGAEAELLGVSASAPSSDSLVAPITIIKNGADPTVVLDRKAATTTSIAVDPVEGVIDSTGAGDAFAAGYLTARFERSVDVMGSIVAAHQMARRTLLALGATPAREEW